MKNKLNNILQQLKMFIKNNIKNIFKNELKITEDGYVTDLKTMIKQDLVKNTENLSKANFTINQIVKNVQYKELTYIEVKENITKLQFSYDYEFKGNKYVSTIEKYVNTAFIFHILKNNLKITVDFDFILGINNSDEIIMLTIALNNAEKAFDEDNSIENAIEKEMLKKQEEKKRKEEREKESDRLLFESFKHLHRTSNGRFFSSVEKYLLNQNVLEIAQTEKSKDYYLKINGVTSDIYLQNSNSNIVNRKVHEKFVDIMQNEDEYLKLKNTIIDVVKKEDIEKEKENEKYNKLYLIESKFYNKLDAVKEKFNIEDDVIYINSNYKNMNIYINIDGNIYYINIDNQILLNNEVVFENKNIDFVIEEFFRLIKNNLKIKITDHLTKKKLNDKILLVKNKNQDHYCVQYNMGKCCFNVYKIFRGKLSYYNSISTYNKNIFDAFDELKNEFNLTELYFVNGSISLLKKDLNKMKMFVNIDYIKDGFLNYNKINKYLDTLIPEKKVFDNIELNKFVNKLIMDNLDNIKEFVYCLNLAGNNKYKFELVQDHISYGVINGVKFLNLNEFKGIDHSFDNKEFNNVLLYKIKYICKGKNLKKFIKKQNNKKLKKFNNIKADLLKQLNFDGEISLNLEYENFMDFYININNYDIKSTYSKLEGVEIDGYISNIICENNDLRVALLNDTKLEFFTSDLEDEFLNEYEIDIFEGYENDFYISENQIKFDLNVDTKISYDSEVGIVCDNDFNTDTKNINFDKLLNSEFDKAFPIYDTTKDDIEYVYIDDYFKNNNIEFKYLSYDKYELTLNNGEILLIESSFLPVEVMKYYTILYKGKYVNLHTDEIINQFESLFIKEVVNDKFIITKSEMFNNLKYSIFDNTQKFNLLNTDELSFENMKFKYKIPYSYKNYYLKNSNVKSKYSNRLNIISKPILNWSCFELLNIIDMRYFILRYRILKTLLPCTSYYLEEQLLNRLSFNSFNLFKNHFT